MRAKNGTRTADTDGEKGQHHEHRTDVKFTLNGSKLVKNFFKNY